MRKREKKDDRITKINNTNQDLGYLDAVRSIEGRGRLPTNLELDEIINNPLDKEENKEEYERLKSADYLWAWSSTFTVYRAPGVAFQKGEDLIDSRADDQGRNWIFPSKYIPKEAIGKKDVVLTFTLSHLEEKDGKILVHPGKVAVHSFPSKNGWYNVSKETGIPENISGSSSNAECRYLWRRQEDSVRPVSRGYVDFVDDGRRGVYCDFRFGYRLGVGWVSDKQTKTAKKNECKHMELRKQKDGVYRCKKCREIYSQ